MRLQLDRAPSIARLAWQSLPVGLALSAIALFVFDPHDALTKARLVGFAACHQIPDRSLFIDGHQLPLCARCTGIYLGMLAGWVWLVGRGRARAANLPPRPIVWALVGFIVLMGVDGVNSLLMLVPGAPHLYETQNWMRLFTGALYGVAVSMLLTPYVAVTLWREPSGERTLKSPGELLLLVNVAAGLVMLALSRASFMLWPLVAVSLAGVLGLIGLMMTSIVVALTGKMNACSGWRDLLAPGALGLGLALVGLMAIDVLRVGAI